MPKISLRLLFCITFVIAGVLGLVAQEPRAVGWATLFCLLSYVGISSLLLFSGLHLVKTVVVAFEQRSLLRLAHRIRWMPVDLVILMWLFTTIVVSNFVLENSIAEARWGITYGSVLGPVLVGAIWAWHRKGAGHRKTKSNGGTNGGTNGLPVR